MKETDKPNGSGLILGSEPLETVRHRASASDDKRGDDDSTDSDKKDSDLTDKGDSGDDSRDTDGKD